MALVNLIDFFFFFWMNIFDVFCLLIIDTHFELRGDKEMSIYIKEHIQFY
jgi:hypothetical protein